MLRDIPGYEGRYAITEDGRVWSYKRPGKKSGGFLVNKVDKDGYLRIGLFGKRVDGKAKIFTSQVSRLVLTAFVGLPPAADSQANHKDGNKQNNHYSNLEWSSPLENTHHAIRTKLVDGRKERFVEFEGQIQPLAPLVRRFQISYFVVHARIFKSGWDVEKALTHPVQKS